MSGAVNPPSPPSGRKNARAGGALLALAIIAGVIGGSLLGQPSLGFLAGLGVGLLLTGLVWLVDRRG